MTTADPLAILKNQFTSIGGRWKELRKETGKFLLEARKSLSGVQFGILQTWIDDNYKINRSEQDVCIGIADNTIPEEVAGRVPASTLCKIAADNMPQLDRVYHINSPTAGGQIKKAFREFTKEEIKATVGQHGIREVDAEPPASKRLPFQRAKATTYRIDGDELILFVPRLDKEVAIKITQSMANDIAKAVSEGGSGRRKKAG